MAGPLRPRWVINIFSRNCCCPMETTTSVETPLRSQKRRPSSWSNIRGASAGRVCWIVSPNWRARRYPKLVAPILGMERPPVATTSEGALNWFSPAYTLKPPSCRTSSMLMLVRMRTPAALHSCSSIVTICCAEPSQKSCPSIFSW